MKKYFPENYLISTQENKNILLSKASLKEAYYSGKILEARATVCDKDHNLHVDLGVMKGIIPRDEGAIGISDGSVRDIAIISRVNKPVVCRIIDFKTDEKGEVYAVLSRRSVQQDCMRDYISTLTPGCVIDAVVTHMESFGVFADIGAGICALMPIDSISVSRIPHPSARFTAGEKIKAVVKSVDENGRILDSIKRISHDTSSVREVLPGKEYSLPPSQGKLNPLEADFETFKNLAAEKTGLKTVQFIYQNYTGISPASASEIA